MHRRPLTYNWGVQVMRYRLNDCPGDGWTTFEFEHKFDVETAVEKKQQQKSREGEEIHLQNIKDFLLVSVIPDSREGTFRICVGRCQPLLQRQYPERSQVREKAPALPRHHHVRR